VSNDEELIALANQLGFFVNQADLNQDSRDSAITEWFERAISPPLFNLPLPDGRYHPAE
jgi:hypothetical protein